MRQGVDKRLVEYDAYKQSLKRKPALSPRVFNFYELSHLSPATMQHPEVLSSDIDLYNSNN